MDKLIPASRSGVILPGGGLPRRPAARQGPRPARDQPALRPPRRCRIDRSRPHHSGDNQETSPFPAKFAGRWMPGLF